MRGVYSQILIRTTKSKIIFINRSNGKIIENGKSSKIEKSSKMVNAAWIFFQLLKGSAEEGKEIEMWLERHEFDPKCMTTFAQRNNSQGEMS